MNQALRESSGTGEAATSLQQLGPRIEPRQHSRDQLAREIRQVHVSTGPTSTSKCAAPRPWRPHRSGLWRLGRRPRDSVESVPFRNADGLPWRLSASGPAGNQLFINQFVPQDVRIAHTSGISIGRRTSIGPSDFDAPTMKPRYSGPLPGIDRAETLSSSKRRNDLRRLTVCKSMSDFSLSRIA